MVSQGRRTQEPFCYNHYEKFLFLTPEEFGLVGGKVQITGQNEEVIGKTVDVFHHIIGYGMLGRKGADATLGTAAYRAAKMGTRCTVAASGEHKAVEGRQESVYFVDATLYDGNLTLGQTACLVKRRGVYVGCQRRTYDEETILYVTQQAGIGIIGRQNGREETDGGIQFVDGAVGFETNIFFGYALAAYQ